MSSDMYMKITGVKGESQDHKYKGQIEVLAWSWGLSNSGTMHHGTGGGSGRANFQDISFTKYVDASSANLMLYCANGKHYDEAFLVCRKAGENPLEYIKVTMKKVMVTSVSTGGSGGEDRLTENVTLNFAELDVEYTQQKKDGSGEAPIPFGWDIAAHKSH